MKDIIWSYFFDDGTVLEFVNKSISTVELKQLQEEHGGVIVNWRYAE